MLILMPVMGSQYKMDRQSLITAKKKEAGWVTVEKKEIHTLIKQMYVRRYVAAGVKET